MYYFFHKNYLIVFVYKFRNMLCPIKIHFLYKIYVFE